jgi:hypothetical protein
LDDPVLARLTGSRTRRRAQTEVAKLVARRGLAADIRCPVNDDDVLAITWIPAPDQRTEGDSPSLPDLRARDVHPDE